MVALDLDVSVLPDQQRLRVEGRVRLRLDADSSRGPALVMNARAPAMRYVSVQAAGASVSLNETLPQDTAYRVARVEFPDVRRRGAEIEVAYTCESTGPSFQLLVTKEVAIASWVEAWYPVPMTTDGFSARLASAPGTTRFRLPRGWRAVSNGRLIEDRTTRAGTVNTWGLGEPAARSFAAARFTVARESARGRDIGVYLTTAEPARAKEQARVLSRALTAMEARFGPYPYPSYAIVELPDGVVDWAASSEQGFIMATTEMFAVRGGNLPLFAHEAAHGWWGNLVNAAGPSSLLVSEALAQYSAVVAIETIEGAPAAREFLRFSRPGYNPVQSALGYFHIWREGGDKPLAALASDRWDHNLSDSKGMWFYQMLRQEVGDDVFFETLRRLLSDFAGRSMTLADVRAAFLAAAPQRSELEGFLVEWLDRPGAPVLDFDWWSVPKPDGWGVAIRVRQRQPGDAYHLSLEVAVTTGDGNVTRDTLTIREKDEARELEFARRPVDVRFDPDHRILMWRPEYGPRPSGPGS